MKTTPPMLRSNGKTSIFSPVQLLLISPFLAVDAAQLICELFFREKMAHFACSALPVLKISSIFIPPHLSTYAAAQCPLHASTEPAFSIFFFMLKITLIILIITSLLIRSYIPICKSTEDIEKVKKKNKEQIAKIKKAGGLIHFLKDGFSVPMGVTLFAFILYLDIGKHTIAYQGTLSAKFKDDLYCFIFTISLFLVLACSINIILYGLYKFKIRDLPDAEKDRL